MKSRSLVNHIQKLALSWTVAAMILTLTLSGSVFFILLYKQTAQEIKNTAMSILSSYRTDILSGDVRSIELQLNKQLEISSNEKLIFLDQNKNSWISDLKDQNIQFCNDQDGLCHSVFNQKVILDMPIYFDSEKKTIWGYIHIERIPKANWPLIFTVTLAIIFGMLFQAFGFYFNLSKAIKSVSNTISLWANKLSVNPKMETDIYSSPYSEMDPIENALAGLRHEIKVLENLAREEGALSTLRGVGHDILNPVSRLKRLLGLIEIKMSKSSSFDQELFLNCNSNLKRLSSYAEQLKILYKKNSGENHNIETSPLDVSKEILQLTHELSSDPAVISKNIKFESNLAQDCLARIPSSALGRMLENIIGNSIYASKDNATIKLSSCIEKENTVFIIEDSGNGIPENMIDKIFESDFSTKANKGTGLGLFVVKQLCEEYNGQISVDSKINQGTRIKLTFPRVEVTI